MTVNMMSSLKLFLLPADSPLIAFSLTREVVDMLPDVLLWPHPSKGVWTDLWTAWESDQNMSDRRTDV